jgi:hypothetical protein
MYTQCVDHKLDKQYTVYCMWIALDRLKRLRCNLKVRMHEIFKVCFLPFFCIILPLIDIKNSIESSLSPKAC